MTTQSPDGRSLAQGPPEAAAVPPKPRRAHRLWGRVSLVVLLFHVLGLLSSMHAVINSRSAQGAIAWGVSLNTFPYVAVPAYWVLGRRSFQGYVEAWRDREEEVEELHTTMRSRLAPFVVDSVERIPGYEALKRLSRTPFLRGNDVDLLIDGAATFDSIFAGLAQAQQYALVEFYIVHDDGLGRRLQAAMADCARRGVEVYFLYDEVGSHNLPGSYLSALEAAGVRQSKFNTTQGAHNRFQINFRNHRKIVVVDGQVAWIGGHNVGDEYLGLDPEVGHWRDTHVRIEGPAAQVAQTVFLADWYWATRTVPSLEWQPRAAPGGGDVMAMVLPIAPTDRLETAELFFIHALNAARERIWIATPYFVPDEAVMAALRLAAMRGVDVRVIVPDKSDNLVSDLATRWFASELAGVGIRFYRYTDGFPHQKVVLVDGDIASVGTANFDNRSFRLQFEVNAVFYDAPFGRKVEAMLVEDMARSAAWEPEVLSEEPLPKRLAVSVARLTAPLL
jgi:cardiolipin synthase